MQTYMARLGILHLQQLVVNIVTVYLMYLPITAVGDQFLVHDITRASSRPRIVDFVFSHEITEAGKEVSDGVGNVFRTVGERPPA
jgi:hypothetical protein